MKLWAMWPSSIYFKGNKQLMDEYSAKKGTNRMIVPRKGIGDAFRDTADAKHRNGPLCSRLGCSGRVNPPKVDKAGSSGKGKAFKHSFRSSSSGKEAVGSSSRTTNNSGKSLIEPQKTLSSWLETDSSETSSIQDEPAISGLIPSPENFTGGLRSDVENVESDKAKVMEIGSSSVASKTRSQRNFHQKAGLCNQEIKITGPVTRAATSRYGLRNLRCNSISDVIPSSCSSSDSNLNRRKDMIKRRNCEGESSFNARGKKTTGSSFEGRNSGARNGISISDSQRSRNIPPHRDSSNASVRTQRFNSAHARGRLSSQVNENHVTAIESPVMTPPSPHSGLNAPGILYHNHTFSDTPLIRPNSYSRPGTSSDQFCGVRPASPAEFNLINRDSFRRHNMDGIAEVFLALERIERDGELTHEQILLLETNLLLNGLNFFDHHRDMRLDIDNMSYEELLALEESMGSVSTALTEEALSECLKRSIYQSAPTDDTPKSFKEDKDDIKCCICQEEYVVGDEVGILQCQHKYHVVCIQQWLRLKNWCPVCKVSAAPSNSSSPH